MTIALPGLWLPPKRQFVKPSFNFIRNLMIGGVGSNNPTIPSLFTFVQSGDSGTGSTSSGSSSVLSSNVTIGDAVVLCLESNATTSGDISSISSSIGSFSKVVAYSNGTNNDLEIWYCASATGAANAVTVNCGSGAWWCQATEWAHSGTVVGVSAGHNSGLNVGTTASQSITPAGNGDLAIAVVESGNTWSSGNPSAPWTDYNAGGWVGSPYARDVAWQLVPSSSTVTAAWSGAGGYWQTVGAYFT